ncbi:rab GTPase-activating protein 1 isoform X2 [Nematostella vectensis]|uniref:rab GTPase-activating protein 1 isoform X2 n=1 Tax=Nematostella vectensis TaxID=45351 RepID=UPI002076F3D0|nr:rab GTPase-activating protein 1 isoform X2 [Nematostella vectensis]
MAEEVAVNSSPSSPSSQKSNGEQEFIMLATPDIDTASDTTSGKSKSQASSIGSFAEVNIPDTEATLDKDYTDEEVTQLVEDARKEIPGKENGRVEDETNRYSLDSGIGQLSDSKLTENEEESEMKEDGNKVKDVIDNRERASSAITTSTTNDTTIDDETLRNRASTDVGSGEEDEIDEDAARFSGIMYLGSSTVNAPVSEIELKRTMVILREQSQVTIDVDLVVGSTSKGKLRLVDPETNSDIATYRVQRIIFCGRGDVDGQERDCFAFNTVHGDTDIFHCHVFKCKEPEMAGKILKSFSVAFKKHRKHGQQIKSPVNLHNSLTPLNNLLFKFDVTLDILEDDGKGFVSVSRDKACFKLRQNLQKKVLVTVQQLSNRHIIVERCFGLLICPGRNIRHSDMHLLSGVSMEIQDNGRLYSISGLWNPASQDLLVLNTESPKDTRVFMTIAVDLVFTGVTVPVRFIYETKARIYPTNERLWILTRPKIHDTYVMELKEALDGESGERGYEVKSITSEAELVARGQLLKRQSSPQQTPAGDKNSEDDEEDDEPLLSGTGMVQKECSEQELCSWSELLSKWKDVSTRPRQLVQLVRKGIPEPLRGQVWQMMAGLSENDELVDSYKHLFTKESPTEQVIVWDIHRTFPAHDYFKDSGGEGQEALYKISKAYSVYDEEVGYCQGLSFFIAVLLLHMPEEQAFAVLVKIMSAYGLREVFRNDFQLLHLKFYQLERMIEDSMPDLFSHFQHNNVEAHMYASQWFLTMFTARFPLPMVYSIMDLILCEGTHVIFQVALALLKDARKDLLQMDFEGILKFFRVSMPKKYMEEERYKQLLGCAIGIKVTPKKLRKYEKEYEAIKEKEAQLEDPVERFKRENKRLVEANMRLELENDYLAHELVTCKVTLHSKLAEAEELIEELTAKLRVNSKALTETEDERERFKTEGAQLKEMWRKSMQEAEDEKTRHTAIIDEYKKICSQLDERSEKLKTDLQQELVEIKRRIGQCETCGPLFSDEGQSSLNDDNADSFKASIKVVDSEKRMRELELELAKTKLSLVEAECHSQDIEHKYSALMAAVEAEGNKPWFKRISFSGPKEAK